jgi:hypothetical protein
MHAFFGAPAGTGHVSARMDPVGSGRRDPVGKAPTWRREAAGTPPRTGRFSLITPRAQVIASSMFVISAGDPRRIGGPQ